MRHLRCKRGKRGTGYQPNAGPTSVECIVCVVWDQMENKSNVTLISSFNYCSCFYNNISACVHIQSIGITMCTLQCPSKKKSSLQEMSAFQPLLVISLGIKAKCSLFIFFRPVGGDCQKKCRSQVP